MLQAGSVRAVQSLYACARGGASVAELAENTLKIKKMREATRLSDRFRKETQLDWDLMGAIEWTADRTPEQV